MNELTKIYKTMVIVEGTANIVFCDTIQHEGTMWLVPYWRDSPSQAWTMPGRMVCLANLAHQHLPPSPEAPRQPDYIVEYPVPQALFRDEPLPEDVSPQYLVRDDPPIRIALLS